ncbi:relaxase/mobilization nuclease domain-containing protein [Rubrivivax gelatinosus]|uniref:relaxase/mobilization nuclease domain-containing protein n=1 Tax=Rubrivivax gelatinosus TaxID=28068 RepID=UPI001F5B820E|nr:relaxase/mobilization nuclease domain-containing protein [Rubrivivax gelatinosus]
MADPKSIDGVLVEWGDRLFYPGNRRVAARPEPRLRLPVHQRAAAIRRRIEATVIRRAPQVMVKVTGGGRGMKAIAAHFRYITKNGRLDVENERGETSKGKEALHELFEEWRYGGSLIGDESPRREAFNIMLSMPRGSAPPEIVLRAAREFAREELAGHKVVMVLHDHQANPHVHLSVRAEGADGRRLNPRKADLHRWRETFAEKLRGWGIDAEATRQGTRGVTRRYDALWQQKARADGRLMRDTSTGKTGASTRRTLDESRQAWSAIAAALEQSGQPDDQRLAMGIRSHLGDRDRLVVKRPEIAAGRDRG